MQPIPRADGVATLVGETEEDRIAALFQQSDEQWQKQSQQLAMFVLLIIKMSLQIPHFYSPRLLSLHRSQAQKGLNWRPRPPPAPSGSSAATTTTGASNGPNVRPVVQANAYQANEYMRPLPPTYVCFRCGMKGHWIQFCPTLSNKEFDKFRVKKTTGIPKAFLKTVQGGEQGLAALPQDMIQQGVMVTPTGELVVQQINDKAWKEHSARTQAQAAAVNLDHIFDQALELEQKGKVPKGHLIPAVFQCFLCKGLARDAVRVACCQSVFCDACIRSELHAQLSRGVDVSTTCPSCHQLTSTDKLIPDNALRREIQSQLNKVADFIRRSGAGSIAAVDRLQSVSPLPSQSSSAAADSRPMSREEGGQTQTPEKDDRRQYVVDDRDYRNRPRDRAYHHGDRDRSYNGDRDRYRRPRENEDRLQQRRRSSSRERRHRREDDERRPRERSRSPYRSKRARSRSDSRSRHSRRRS